jgi:hypothetical protein
MAWSDKFSRPIKWGLCTMHTLQDARGFLLSFSGLRSPVPNWEEAHTLLAQAAEHGGLWRDLARIEIMKELLGSTRTLKR